MDNEWVPHDGSGRLIQKFKNTYKASPFAENCYETRLKYLNRESNNGWGEWYREIQKEKM